MNLEKVSVLSQKIEGILGTVRALKEENAKVRRELSSAVAAMQDKSLLLDTANANLADCKAALDARANQVNAQEEMLNQKDAEIATLNEKVTILGQQLIEKDGCIESLNSKVQELSSNTDLLTGQVNEKAELLNTLNAHVVEKDATIASLMTQLNEKNNEIDSLNEQLQAQNDEIAEAQEKFNQLVATIESELGTDITLDNSEIAAPVDTDISENASVETVDNIVEELQSTVATETPEETDETEIEESATKTEPEEVAEPQVDESVSQETEEDIPTIEVHGANEEDNDLFASEKEGSQTNFFG